MAAALRPGRRTADGESGRTFREAEMLYWVGHGKTNQEVAEILHASLNTVKKHVSNILVKVGVESRLIAALQAAERLEPGTTDPAKFRPSAGTRADGSRPRAD